MAVRRHPAGNFFTIRSCISFPISLIRGGGWNSIDDWPCVFKVKRIYSLIVNIVLRRIEVDHLTSMATIMKEETVVGSRIIDEPMHRSKHIGFCRNHGLQGWIIVS